MTKEEIRTLLLGVKPRTKEVPVEGIGTFYIRQMTGSERDEIENLAMSNRGGEARAAFRVSGIRALSIILSVVDEAGERVFTRKDVDAVNAIPTAVSDVLYEQIQIFNGMRKEEKQELGEPSGGEAVVTPGSSSPSSSAAQ